MTPGWHEESPQPQTPPTVLPAPWTLVENPEAPAPPVEKRGEFEHSDDYTSVTLRGLTWTITPLQAQMIQILHEAHESGRPDVRTDYILVEIGTENRAKDSRWQDTWKSNPQARKALIKLGARKGALRLNL